MASWFVGFQNLWCKTEVCDFQCEHIGWFSYGFSSKEERKGVLILQQWGGVWKLQYEQHHFTPESWNKTPELVPSFFICTPAFTELAARTSQESPPTVRTVGTPNTQYNVCQRFFTTHLNCCWHFSRKPWRIRFKTMVTFHTSAVKHQANTAIESRYGANRLFNVFRSCCLHVLTFLSDRYFL